MYLDKRISIIIPAKNEAGNIVRILPEIPGFIDEILLVTSSTEDNTLDSLNTLNHENRLIPLIQIRVGKGDAQKVGLSHATGDYICMIDADGSVNLNEIRLMLDLLIRNNLDLVKGSRYLKSGGSEDLTNFRSFGNLFLTKITNVLFSQNWSDLAYGFVGYKNSSVKDLDLHKDTKIWFLSGYNYGDGFELETVILTRMSRMGYKIEEFPSFELKRIEGFSNLRAIRDGFRLLFAIFYERFSKFKMYD
jgi:glycosyltransferase involved in cell wall biosynthesis